MFTKEIARLILGGFSEETRRWLIGAFLVIPTVIVPVIVIIFLFAALRAVAPVRKTAILNLLAASGAALLIVPTAIIHRNFSWLAWSIGSSLALSWLLCAAGLFFHKRLAWSGSVLGAGTLTGLVAATFGAAIPAILYPGTEMLDAGYFRVGYVFGCICLLSWLCLALAGALGLLFGLLRIRKEVFGGGTTPPNATLEPTI